jgi:MSHA pilin protein MshD
MYPSRRQAGMSLIEVVIFIIVLGIGFAGILALYNRLTSASVDPLVRKQALAIASSLLEEIELRPFTYCDPDDSAVFTATSTADCDPLKVEGIGAETFSPPGTETRYSSTARFDNVSDYDGFGMAAGAIRTIDDPTPIPGLGNYSVLANVQDIAAGELGAGVPVGEALRITVTATHQPTGLTVSLQGYRLRYAPNAP